MPWCPKCKNEYKAGYTVCADCGSTLVEHLTETDVSPKNAMKEQIIAQLEAEREAKAQWEAMSDEEKTAVMQAKQAHMQEMMRKPYEDAAKKAEEYRTGADSLLIVGVLGLIALVLLHLGIIPISLPPFTKVMITLVMGVMFVIFIVTGILSRKSYQSLKSQASSDENTKDALVKYLKDTINPAEFDSDLNDDDPSMEILYFRRMEKLKALVYKRTEGIDASFAEYILEEIYPEIFE